MPGTTLYDESTPLNSLGGLLTAVLGKEVDTTSTGSQTTTGTTGQTSTGSSTSSQDTTGSSTQNTTGTSSNTGTSSQNTTGQTSGTQTGSQTGTQSSTGTSTQNSTSGGTSTSTATQASSSTGSTTNNTSSQSSTSGKSSETGSSTQTTQGTQSTNTSGNTSSTGTQRTSGGVNTDTSGIITNNSRTTMDADVSGLRDIFARQSKGVTPEMIKAIFEEGARAAPNLILAHANAVGSRVSGNSGVASSLGDLETKLTRQVADLNRTMLSDAGRTAASIADNTRNTTTTGTQQQSATSKEVQDLLTQNDTNTVMKQLAEAITNSTTSGTHQTDTTNSSKTTGSSSSSGTTSNSTTGTQTQTATNTGFNNTTGTQSQTGTSASTNQSTSLQDITQAVTGTTSNTGTQSQSSTGTNQQSSTGTQNTTGTTTGTQNQTTTANNTQNTTTSVNMNTARNLATAAAAGLGAAALYRLATGSGFSGGVSSFFNWLKGSGISVPATTLEDLRVAAEQDAAGGLDPNWANSTSGDNVDEATQQWLQDQGIDVGGSAGDYGPTIDYGNGADGTEVLDDPSIWSDGEDLGINFADGGQVKGYSDGGFLPIPDLLAKKDKKGAPDPEKDDENTINEDKLLAGDTGGALGLGVGKLVGALFGGGSDSSNSASHETLNPMSSEVSSGGGSLFHKAPKSLSSDAVDKLTKEYNSGNFTHSIRLDDSGLVYSPTAIKHEGEDADPVNNQLIGFAAHDPNNMKPGDTYLQYDPTGSGYKVKKIEDGGSVKDLITSSLKDLGPVISMIGLGTGIGGLLSGNFGLGSLFKTAMKARSVSKQFANGGQVTNNAPSNDPDNDGDDDSSEASDTDNDGGKSTVSVNHDTLMEAMGISRGENGGLHFNNHAMQMMHKVMVAGNKKKETGYADGKIVGNGLIQGPGNGVSDSIRAKGPGGRNIRVSHNEYILPADTTAAIGVENLDKLVDATHVPAEMQRAMIGE